MLKRHKQPAHDRGQGTAETMSRHESAVWLGRALSTGEVALRAILELMDLLAYQQALMHNVVAAHESPAPLSQRDDQDSHSADEPAAGSSEQVLQKLEELRTQITPVLQAVEEACRQLEQMLAERTADH